MKRFILLVLALALALPCFADNGKLWHWRTENAQTDPWNRVDSPWRNQIDYAWFDHGVGSYIGTQWLMQNRHYSWLRAGTYTFIGGALYSVKDALVPMNKGWWGRYGGGGFSYKDVFVRNTTGIVSAWAVNWITTKRPYAGLFYHKRGGK